MSFKDGNLEVYDEWQWLVSNYSNREMTKELDKLPALSGVAHKFADITGDLSLARI